LTTAVTGVLQTLGILLDSLLILGDVPTGLAWLGVATGAIGVVAELLPPVFGWAYVLCGVLLLVWLIGIAFVRRTLGAQTLRNRQLEAAEAIEPAQP
jgi:membrane protein implicated in regulation of membrane protease activity